MVQLHQQAQAFLDPDVVAVGHDDVVDPLAAGGRELCQELLVGGEGVTTGRCQIGTHVIDD